MQKNQDVCSQENVISLLSKLDREGLVMVLHCAFQQEKRVKAEGAAPLWRAPYCDADPTIAKWLIEAEERANEEQQGGGKHVQD